MSAPAHGHPAAVWPPDRQFGNVRPAKMAMWIFLLSDWFSFAGLLLGYGILRAESTVWHHPGEPSLNIPFTALLTLVLAVSSVTIIRAYDEAAGGRRHLGERHGDTGLLVDPTAPQDVAAALRTLLKDQPLRERMGEAGRKKASGQTWAGFTRRLEQVAQAAAQERT